MRSLIGVVAQRLVRMLDPDTKQAYPAREYECRALGVDSVNPPTLYQPRDDSGDGYRGRTGIYEMVAVDDEMRTMIHDGAGEHEMERYARTQSPSIRDDGLRQVRNGTTTLEEVLRVTTAD